MRWWLPEKYYRFLFVIGNLDISRLILLLLCKMFLTECTDSSSQVNHHAMVSETVKFFRLLDHVFYPSTYVRRCLSSMKNQTRNLDISIIYIHPATQDAVDGGALSHLSLLQHFVSHLFHVEHEGVQRLLHLYSLSSEGQRRAQHMETQSSTSSCMLCQSGFYTYESDLKQCTKCVFWITLINVVKFQVKQITFRLSV